MSDKYSYDTRDPFSVRINRKGVNKDSLDKAVKKVSNTKSEILGKALDHYDIPRTKEGIDKHVTLEIDESMNENYFMKGELAVTISSVFAKEGKAYVQFDRHYLKEDNNE